MLEYESVLSTRIRNYSDVPKDRFLTVAALIGAPTVREGLLQDTRLYLRSYGDSESRDSATVKANRERMRMVQEPRAGRENG